MVFLDWDQAMRLAEAHNERFRALIYLAVDSGMRWGELVGLRRGRVDLLRGKVRVTEQLTQLEDRSWIRQPPKTTAGVRSITTSAFTTDVLREHIERFAQPGAGGLVFPNAAGHPLSSSSFRGHHFGRALREAGLSCRFHDLRVRHEAPCIRAG
jgi:integrase